MATTLQIKCFDANCTELFHSQLDYAQHILEKHLDNKDRIGWAERYITKQVNNKPKENTVRLFSKEKKEKPVEMIEPIKETPVRTTPTPARTDTVLAFGIPEPLYSLLKIMPQPGQDASSWKAAFDACFKLVYPS